MWQAEGSWRKTDCLSLFFTGDQHPHLQAGERLSLSSEVGCTRENCFHPAACFKYISSR